MANRSTSAAAHATALLALGLAAVVAGGCNLSQEANPMSEPQGSDAAQDPGGPAGEADRTETATFAAGCFWGVETTFRKVPGVVDAAVGYAGGHFKNPTYEDVCADRTGHAEVVQVTYDPTKVTYDRLLDVFWTCHDPTTRNRQGPDVGSQYRSAVFFHTPGQEAAAKASKAKLQAGGAFGGREIVTEIVPASTFWRAEEYHQRYLEKHGRDTCRLP